MGTSAVGVARRSDNDYIYLQPPGSDAKKPARLNNFREAAPLWSSTPPSQSLASNKIILQSQVLILYTEK